MNKTKIFMLFVLLSSFDVLAQTTVSDWKLALQKATHDTTRLKCYIQISVCFRPTNIDSTLFYLQKAGSLSKIYPNHLHSLEYFLELGNYFTEKGEHLAAESAFENAKATAQKINYKKNAVYIESRFALNLLGKGEHYKSIKSYLALLIQIKPANATDSALMYRMYHNLAINYIELDDFKKALIYVDKKATFITSDIERVAYYQQKGLVLMKLKQYPAATTILNRAIALAQKIKSVRFGILATINLAEVARMNNQHKEAVVYNLQTIDLAQKHGFVYEQMVATTNLGATYLDLKEYNKALGLFKNTIVHFREAKRSYDLSKSLEYISQTYDALGDYKNAYLNHTSFTKVKGEIVGAEKQKLIDELDAQYILAEKQQQIAAQELQNKIQEENIKIEKRQKLLLMTLFGAVLLFLFGTLWNFRKQKKLSETLSLQKDKIEKQALQLANTNQSKDKLFALLAHDLKSPIANLVNSLELCKNDKADGFKTTIGHSFLQVYHELENVQLILNNLLQWSSLQLKDSTPHFQVVLLNQLMNFIIKQVETTATEKRITIINNLTESNIWADENQIQIVLRNVLSNSLKYTPEDGFIKISSTETSDETIVLMIRDNGIGISPENLQHIFQYPISQNGTQGEKGTGIGLSLAKELIEKNGGTIEIKSVVNKGTEVYLSFKKRHNQQN